MNKQSGLLLDGPAMTRPEAAPETLAPLGPMLLRTPCRAIGLSEEMKLSSEPVARMRRWSGSAGRPKHGTNTSEAAHASTVDDRLLNILLG